MMIPTAEVMPRESFLIGRLAGRSKSRSSECARSASQAGKSIAAASRASRTRKWSG